MFRASEQQVSKMVNVELVIGIMALNHKLWVTLQRSYSSQIVLGFNATGCIVIVLTATPDLK